MQSDIQARLAEINARAANLLSENRRISDALGKAAVVIVSVAMLGIFYAAALNGSKESHRINLVNQEAYAHGNRN